VHSAVEQTLSGLPTTGLFTSPSHLKLLQVLEDETEQNKLKNKNEKSNNESMRIIF